MSDGCVVVALYGVRVHNQLQYTFMRETTSNPELDLIVWQNGHYIEVKASPPNRLFGVKLENYPEPQ